MIGGYVADRYLGQRRAILVGGVLMALGHFAMAFEPLPFFYTALTLLILGNGFFKPNISVIVGNLYAQNDPRRDGAFTIFYMGINLGAFMSPLICGTLGQKIGWHYGFAAAGVGMCAGLVVYLLGRRHLGEIGLRPAAAEAARTGKDAHPPLTRVDYQRIAVLLILGLLGNVVFWGAFEQAGSSLTLFADKATDLSLPMFNWEMPSSWFQSFNPLFIMLFAPLFSMMWVKLAKKGRDPSTPMKFVMGLTFLALGFVAMMAAGALYEKSGPVSMMWLTAAYLLQTWGELCLSPVGLSMVTQLAPARFASLLMGVWFASTALANLVSGFVAGEYDTMNKVTFFSIPVITAGAMAILLLLLVKPLRKMMHGVH
jgi:POT family proton-dependent oligopeptide transporter